MGEFKMKYNYLVVGSGLYGAIFAHEAKKAGKTVLVVDKRPNIAGNVFTEKTEGMQEIFMTVPLFRPLTAKV